MRLFVLSVLIFGSIAVSEPRIATAVDPIVTGHEVSSAHKATWLKQRNMFLDCGGCTEEQPYPGDG